MYAVPEGRCSRTSPAKAVRLSLKHSGVRRDVAPARPPRKAVRLSRLIQRLETLKLETENHVAGLIAKPSNL